MTCLQQLSQSKEFGYGYRYGISLHSHPLPQSSLDYKDAVTASPITPSIYTCPTTDTCIFVNPPSLCTSIFKSQKIPHGSKGMLYILRLYISKYQNESHRSGRSSTCTSGVRKPSFHSTRSWISVRRLWWVGWVLTTIVTHLARDIGSQGGCLALPGSHLDLCRHAGDQICVPWTESRQ